MSRIQPNYQRSILGIFGFGSLKRRHFVRFQRQRFFFLNRHSESRRQIIWMTKRTLKVQEILDFPAFLEHFRDFEHFHVFSRISAFCLSFGTQEQNHRGPGMKAWRTRKHPKSWILDQSAVDLEIFWIRIPETTPFLKGSSDKIFFYKSALQKSTATRPNEGKLLKIPKKSREVWYLWAIRAIYTYYIYIRHTYMK